MSETLEKEIKIKKAAFKEELLELEFDEVIEGENGPIINTIKLKGGTGCNAGQCLPITFPRLAKEPIFKFYIICDPRSICFQLFVSRYHFSGSFAKRVLADVYYSVLNTNSRTIFPFFV